MSDGATLEKELKFAEVELENLRERLRDLDAERRGAPSFEDNLILDRGDKLKDADCVLRLRIDGHGARLTYKGPSRFEDRLKVREEYETHVGDSAATQALLAALGYEPVRRYQKMREEWDLGGVTIALDHTPIGDFVEFEGDGAVTVAKRCGLNAEDSERRTYLRLYEDYRKDHPEAPEDMVFPEDR